MFFLPEWRITDIICIVYVMNSFRYTYALAKGDTDSMIWANAKLGGAEATLATVLLGVFTWGDYCGQDKDCLSGFCRPIGTCGGNTFKWKSKMTKTKTNKKKKKKIKTKEKKKEKKKKTKNIIKNIKIYWIKISWNTIKKKYKKKREIYMLYSYFVNSVNRESSFVVPRTHIVHHQDLFDSLFIQYN